MMRLAGNRIYLRFMTEADVLELVELHCRNREFFQRYTPTRSQDFYTTEHQRQRIEAAKALQERDEKYTFVIFLSQSNELIGVVEFTEVVRGPLQSCWLGYYLDKLQNGHGYTTEAVRLAVDYAFDVLHLHRIEAGVMPHNTGSIKVLEKAGFHQEGLSRKNVKINGKWEDHIHFAKLNSEDT